MRRACFLHQGCSSGSSMTEPLYLLPGRIRSPRLGPRSRVLPAGARWLVLPRQRCPCSPQPRWTERRCRGAGVPPSPRWSPAHSLSVPSCLGSSVQTTQPTEGEIFGGGTAATSDSSCPGRGGGSSTFLRAGMQDAAQSEARSPLPLHSSSDTPTRGGLGKRSGRTQPVLALPMPALPVPPSPEPWLGRPGWQRGGFSNLSIPIGDGEEALKCSRCLGLVCPETEMGLKHSRDNAFPWRVFMRESRYEHLARLPERVSDAAHPIDGVFHVVFIFSA